jgi:hypothetical protein
MHFGPRFEEPLDALLDSSPLPAPQRLSSRASVPQSGSLRRRRPAFVPPRANSRCSRMSRKVKFAIQLLRETADLLETSPKSTFTTKRTRYPRRSDARDE